MTRRRVASPLAAPLLENGESSASECNPSGTYRSGGIAPLLCVTAASLFFGLVSAMLKYVGLPPVLMMQARSLLQWTLSLFVCGWRRYRQPVSKGGQPLVDILFGPMALRQLLLGRALFFWAFMLLWWTSLTTLPVGDATSLVFCWPIMTACWGIVLLKERVHPGFWACLALDLVGLLLIARPSFLFGDPTDASAVQMNPYTGVGAALAAAMVGSILPILVRKSRLCHWTTVEHVTTSLATFVFTPVCLVGWFFYLDPSALQRTRVSLSGGWGQPDGWQPRPWGLAVLLGAASVGFAALALQTYGYQNEQTTRASLMSFIEIPFSYLLQVVVFRDEPELLAMLGVVCILCSGLANVLLVKRSETQVAAAKDVGTSAILRRPSLRLSMLHDSTPSVSREPSFERPGKLEHTVPKPMLSQK